MYKIYSTSRRKHISTSPFQLLDLLEYNPLISNRELQGGSTYSTKFSKYKLEVERPNIEGLEDRLIANYTSILASIYR